MFPALIRLAQKRPGRVLMVAGVVAVIALVVGGSLSAQLTSGLSDYDDPGSPSVAAQSEVRAATGVDLQQGYVLLVRADEPIAVGAPPPPVVQQAGALLRGQPEVKAVVDYVSTNDPRMISRDGRSTYLFAYVGAVNEQRAVDAIQGRIDADPQLRDRVSLGGPTAANVQVSEISTIDLSKAEAIALPVLILLLLIVFRGVVAALLPLLGGIYTIALTLLGMSAVAPFSKLSVFALNLVFALGLGLSIDFSLLMTSRYREELAGGAPPDQALATTVRTTGRTVLFSALTVASALASLLLFPQRFLFSMGIAGILVALSAASFALLVMPALLSLLGERVNALAPARWRHRSSADAGQGWHRFATWVMRRPLALAAAASFALLLLALPLTGIKFTGVDSSILPASSSAGNVDRILRQEFDSATAQPVQIVISAPEAVEGAVAAYASSVAAVPGVQSTGPPQRLGPGLWSFDTFLTSPPLSEEAQGALARIDDLAAPFPARATGVAASFRDLQASLGDRLPLAAGLVVVVTFLLLFFMTGSVVLPIKALLMNALSIGAAFGILVMIFQHGRLEGFLGFTSQGALESTSPIILFALAFGLSTDYGVFLLGRIKEAADSGLETREAVAVGLQHTGGIVTAAAVLFCVPIGALVLSRLTFVKELGLGTAVAVFLDATIVRAVLVPSLMAVLGQHNWWAPRPLRRLHESLHVTGHAPVPRPAVVSGRVQ